MELLQSLNSLWNVESQGERDSDKDVKNNIDLTETIVYEVSIPYY